MAVPKKRMSRTRKLLRQGQWKLKIKAQALKALSLGRSNRNAPTSTTDTENTQNTTEN